MGRWAKTIGAGLGLAGASYAAHVAATWRRYGRPAVAVGPARDERLDAFMPRYDVCDRRSKVVTAPPAATLAAAKSLELDASSLAHAIFRGRELLLGSRADETARPKGLVALTTSIGWGVLADTDDEIILGAVTEPWRPNPVFRALEPARFAAFDEPGHVKIGWTLRAQPAEDGGSIFRTETRAVATDDESRRKFRTYWSLLSPGILLIRAAMLRALPEAAEHAWRLPGDDLLPDARAQLTHATAIAAPPADVWPWLVQMGCQRGGWYSWDRLDNGGRRSAEEIVPELQHLAVGDVLPWRPEGADGFQVLRVEPDRALVLRSAAPDFEGTWAFVLEPLPLGRTRLVTRYRAAYPPSPRMTLTLSFMAAVHAFMERKQLRTIKHHAEQRAGGPARPPAASAATASSPPTPRP